MPYISSARLAKALREVGFDVAAVCNAKHPLRTLRDPIRHFPLGLMGASTWGPFGAVRLVRAAIRVFGPDALAPCDDAAAAIVRRIGLRHAEERDLVERSVGSLASFGILASKVRQVAHAANLGLLVPPSEQVECEADLAGALSRIGAPVYMKQDASWAGLGVLRVDDEAEARRAWRGLSEEHTARAALARVRTHGCRFALSRVRRKMPSVSLQKAIPGQAANYAAYCRSGEVLGGVGAIAIETTSATGPASVIQVMDNPDMARAAVLLARSLNLSGFVGLDFVLDAAGRSWFIEVNPRATPLSALALARADLCREMFGSFSDAAAPRRPSISADLIALFPNELERDRASTHLLSAYHDVPVDEPGLVGFARAAMTRPPGTERIDLALGGAAAIPAAA